MERTVPTKLFKGGENMAEFVMKYWIQTLFGILIGTITWMWKKMVLKKKEYDVLRAGILALLHDRLYQSCSFFIVRGYCSLEDRSNLDYLFTPYKALGGNGTGESLYHKCMDLPFSADAKEKKEET